MTQVRRGYADGPYGQLHYRDNGATGEPLLLLHQAPMSSRQFDRVYEPFAAEGIRAVGMDLPGFGQSDPTADTPTVADYAAAVPALLDHLGIAVAHLGGHHTGAMVCIETAVTFPDRVASLALSGPAPITDAEAQTFLDTIVAGEKAFEPQADGSHFLELWAPRYEWIKEHPEAARLCTDYITQPLTATGPFWWGHDAAFRYRTGERLPLVTQRGLFIANTTDMIYHLAERARSIRPDFAYVELEGGGVDVTDLDPRGWTRAVSDFVRAVREAER